jgi:hypothetical protein
MHRLSPGSVSCYLAIAALLGLAWMAVCRLIIRNTHPTPSPVLRVFSWR